MLTSIHGIIASASEIVYTPETWDISTADYTPYMVWVGGEANVPDDVQFSSDGTKMYILNSFAANYAIVYQYTLSTAWDINTASYASLSYDAATEVDDSVGISFSTDGTKLYMLDKTDDTVHQYTLSTAWDISSASYASKSVVVNSPAITPYGITFKTDGTAMYVADIQQDRIYPFTLSVAWDVSTAVYDTPDFLAVGTQDANPTSLQFKSDGTKLYVGGATNKAIFPYTLSTAWDITSATYDTGVSLDVSEAFTLSSFALSSDGTKVFATDSGNEFVREYTIGTAFDMSTGSFDATSLNVTTQSTNPRSLSFNDDGTAMFIGDFSGGVFQYTLTTAYDVTSATYDSVSADVSTQIAQVGGVHFSPDGTNMYAIDVSTDTIYQYTVGTAWDMSTVTYASKSYNMTSEDSATADLYFSNNGSQMFILGGVNDEVFQYNLSTAWDVSTASYASLSGDVTLQTTGSACVTFSPTGLLMFVGAFADHTTYQYTLTSPFDVSSIVYDTEKAYDTPIIGSQGFGYNISLSPDGSKFYVIEAGASGDWIWQYDLP